ncbi:hypothetical protein EBU71_04215 [bacterium]|nr:hypothetical protein [Candidatus Elulimicrobium humile]
MKIEETIANLLKEAKKAKSLISEQDKEGSAYAIGMAKAKEITGDEPPLEKETIKKAHEIAKGILKKEEISPFTGQALKTEETEEEKKKREEEEKAKAEAEKASTKSESEVAPNTDDKKKEDEKEKEMVKEVEMTDDEKKKAEDEAKAKAEKEKADAVKEQELTDKQKTLPPELQKAIKDKEEKKDAVKEETEEEKAKREAEEKAKAEKEKAEVKPVSESEDESEKEEDEDESEDDKEEDEKEMKSESESEEDDEEKIKDKNAKKPDEVKMNEKTNESIKVDVSADVEALLKGETLSEDFKAKAKVIFENVVINRVKDEIARISNELKTENVKNMSVIKESLIEKVDGYLSYVVEQWVLQNEIALESGIKTEILEEFVSGLRNLFEDHYIEVPNERFDVLSDLQDQLNTTKKKLDEATAENAKISKAFSDLRKNEIITAASKDLVSTDAEKLKSLAEELTFEDDASFEKKVQTIRDNYFSALSATQNSTKSIVDTIVTDEPIVINESAKITDVKIAAYADLLNRSKKQI